MPEPAEQMRAAAQRLRTLAEAATPGPWMHATNTGRKDGISLVGAMANRGTGKAVAVFAEPDVRQRAADAAYVAAMHPGVTLALAEVLEKAAADIADNPNVYAEGTRAEDWYAAELALARLVLEAKMSTAAQSACDIEYPRPGGRQRGDRIVRCDLPRGHHGDHCETDTGSMWHARPPAQTAQDGLAGTDEGARTTEGSQARTGGSLTDIIGLDPNLTGGLDADEYIRRQYCDHGPELDALTTERDQLRRKIEAVRALCHAHAGCAAPYDCDPTAISCSGIAEIRAVLDGET